MKLLIFSETRNLGRSLKDTKLFFLSLVPIGLSALVEVILFVALLYFSISRLLSIEWSEYKSYVFPALTLIFAVGLIYISVTSFYAFVLTVGAPFHDMVSERTEYLRNSSVKENKFWNAVKLGAKFGVSYFLFSLLVMAINFVLGIIPGVGNILGAISSILLGGFAISMGVLSMTFVRHGLHFKDVLSLSKKYWKDVLILGVIMQLLNYIPIVNIMIFPIFIIWGTLLALKILEIEN